MEPLGLTIISSGVRKGLSLLDIWEDLRKAGCMSNYLEAQKEYTQISKLLKETTTK